MASCGGYKIESSWSGQQTNEVFRLKGTGEIIYNSGIKVWFLLRVHPRYSIGNSGNHFYIGTDRNNTAIDLGGFVTSPYYYTTYTDFGTCPVYCGWEYEYNTVGLSYLVHAFASSTLEELLDKLTVHYFPSNTYYGNTCGTNYAENFYTIFTPRSNIKDYIRSRASQLIFDKLT